MTVSPYLAVKRQQYEHLRAEIEQLHNRAVDEKRDLSEDELRSVTEHGQRGQQLYAEIEALAQEQQRHESVARLAGDVAAGGAGFENVGGDGSAPSEFPRGVVGPLMPTPTQVDDLYRAASTGTAAKVEHMRAAIDTADSGRPQVAMSRLDGRRVRRLAEDARLPMTQVAGVTSAVFPVFGAVEAAITAEGIAKSEYSAITPATVVPQVIAIWSDVTMQVLTSMTAFESALINRHMQGLAKREDKLIIDTITAAAGTQTLAGTTGQDAADTLLAAASLVLDSGVSQLADLAVINPADVPRIFAGSTGRQGESPESQLRLNLHGMRCYPSRGVPVGTAIVGAWSAAAAFVVGLPPTTKIDPYSGMKNNITTLLSEEAVGLAVVDPPAFVLATFAA